MVRSPDKPATSGLGLILKTAGFSNAADEVYAAQYFLKSRDALGALNRNQSFVRAFSGEGIAYPDRFGTLITGRSSEDLFRFYKRHVVVDHDTTSSVTTLSVRAFSPRDAVRFNEQLMQLAETTINRMNERARNDLIGFAMTEVDEARHHASDAATTLARFRDHAGVIDPDRQAAVQIQMISKLQDELIATRTQLLALRKFTPSNPQIEVYQTRASGLEQEIRDASSQVAGARTSLAGNAVEYQRLLLESQFADKQVASALTSLEEARNEARRKQAYIERIAQPSEPDRALEPQRVRGMVSTLALGAGGVGHCIVAAGRRSWSTRSRGQGVDAIMAQTSLAQSFAIQRRVIHAMLMREVLTRYGRHNIGFLWIFVEPMMFTLGVATLWTLTRAVHGSHLPIVGFALTGYSSVLLWRSMPFRCMSAIEPNLSLRYHRNVKIIDIYVARLLLEVGGTTISFAVLAAAFTIGGLLDAPADVLRVLEGWALLAWFGMALAALMGALAFDYEMIEKLWHPLSYLLVPLSGVAFSVDALPRYAQDAALVLPMVHGVEMIRAGYFGTLYRAHYDPMYLVLWSTALTLCALARLRKVEREVIPQ